MLRPIAGDGKLRAGWYDSGTRPHVCALQASELIRDRYFDGECILAKDAIEDLEQQVKMLQTMMHNHDRVVIEAGQPEFATSDKLRFGSRVRTSRPVPGSASAWKELRSSQYLRFQRCIVGARFVDAKSPLHSSTCPANSQRA